MSRDESRKSHHLERPLDDQRAIKTHLIFLLLPNRRINQA